MTEDGPSFVIPEGLGCFYSTYECMMVEELSAHIDCSCYLAMTVYFPSLIALDVSAVVLENRITSTACTIVDGSATFFHRSDRLVVLATLLR